MNKVQKITACIFLEKDGKLFLAKRSNSKALFPGQFEVPGGHIEFGETLEEGLKREIREELSIEINLGEVFNAFTYTSYNDTVHSVEVDYLATMKDPNQEIKLNSNDHTEYKWVTQTEAQETLKDNPEVFKAANKFFKLINQ